MHLYSRLALRARPTAPRAYARPTRLVLFAVAAAAILAVATGSAASAPVVAFSSGPAAKSPPQPVGDRLPGHPNKKALPAGADTYAPYVVTLAASLLSLLVHLTFIAIAAVIYVGGAQAGGAGGGGNNTVGVAVMTEAELGQLQNR